MLRKKILGLLLLVLNFTVFSYSQEGDKNLSSGDVVVPRKIDLIPIPMIKLPHAVESVSWNQDCSLFAYSENRNITIRNASDYSIFQTIVSDISVNSQDFAGVTATEDRSNQLVTFNEDNSIFIRRLPDTTPAIVRSLNENYVISKYAFSKNGNYIAIGTEGGTIELGQQLYYSNDIITQRLEGHTQKVYELAFSPDRRFLASASLDGTIKIWRTSTRLLEAELIQNYPPPQFIPICFSGDSESIIAPRAKRLIEIRDFSGNEKGRIETRQDINSLCLSTDGKSVVVLTNQNQFQYYSIETKKFEKYIPAWNASPVTCYKFSNDGLSLLVGHSDGSIYILKLDEVTYLDGEVPENYRIVFTDEDKEEELNTEELMEELEEKYGDEDDDIPDRITTGHNVEFRLQGVYATNSYYKGGIKAGLGYINDRFVNVCYFGAMVCPTLFFADKGTFPYEYKIGNVEVSKPMLAEFDGIIILGKEWAPWVLSDWRVYAEGFIGGALKELISPTLGNGKLNTALIGGGHAGFRYKGIGFFIEAAYDTVVKFQTSLGMSYRVRFTRKTKPTDLERLKAKIEEEKAKEREYNELKTKKAKERAERKSLYRGKPDADEIVVQKKDDAENIASDDASGLDEEKSDTKEKKSKKRKIRSSKKNSAPDSSIIESSDPVEEKVELEEIPEL